MPIEHRFYHRGDYCYSVAALLSERRRERINHVVSNEINFGDDEELEECREKITRMGGWDRFIDWACHDGKKHLALEAMADIILLAKAKDWPEDADMPSKYPSSDELRCGSFSRLLQMLTPEGKRAMLAKSEPAGDLVRLSPSIGMPTLDRLLTVEMPAQLAGYWLEEAHLTQAASIAVGHVLTVLSRRRDVDVASLARLSAKQARLAERPHPFEPMLLPYDAPRQAWANAAKYWRMKVAACPNNHKAADFCWEEAESWRAAGKPHKEAAAACDAGNRWRALAESAVDRESRLVYEKKSAAAFDAMELAHDTCHQQQKRMMNIDRYTRVRHGLLTSLRA